MSGTSVLFVSSEVHPLAKTGGLADVAGALPIALAAQGFDIRILLPAYPGTLEAAQAHPVSGPVELLPRRRAARLHLGTLPETDLPVYLLECPELYDRHGSLYVGPNGHDWPDNAERFGLLSKAAALFGSAEGLAGWRADLLHCNDWQTGLAPAYLHFDPQRHAHALFGIHNLAFVGTFPEELLPVLDLPLSSYCADGVEFFGSISFLKAGIYYADHITTVSPTYAKEIQTDAYGYGLQGLLHWRNQQLTGILNGIDTQHWNPAIDPFLPATYGGNGKLSGKHVCRQALQERLGLSVDDGVAILGMVSRMTWQKGVDLVLDTVERLMEQPIQLVILGSGDPNFEQRWQAFAQRFPQRISVTIGYNEELSHWIEAGSDIFLMPSRYEPCGLNQLYSMAYGTPPVAHRTGGLADSIVDTSPRSLHDGTATGFLFDGNTANDFYGGLLRALLAFQSKKLWRHIQQAGMTRDFSWTNSAEQYADLYHALLS